MFFFAMIKALNIYIYTFNFFTKLFFSLSVIDFLLWYQKQFCLEATCGGCIEKKARPFYVTSSLRMREVG